MNHRRASNVSGPDVMNAIHRAHITLFNLWVYYGICGNLAELDIEAFLYNSIDVPTMDHLILSRALVELLADQSDPR